MLLSRLESSKDRYYDYKSLILCNIFIEEPLVWATLGKNFQSFFSNLQATDTNFSPGYLELNLQA